MNRLLITVAVALAATAGSATVAGTTTVGGKGCFDAPATIVADGPGTIYGTGGRDVILADDGYPQTIYALGGNDLVYASRAVLISGGSGADTLDGNWNIAVHGDSGNDDFVFGDAADFCDGGCGIDAEGPGARIVSVGIP